MNSALDRLVMTALPSSEAAEKFRIARTAMLHLESGSVRSLIITSPWSGDGKSMVCANLAVACAQIGKRVTIVDCDLRRPALTCLFGATGEPGLADAAEQGTEPSPLLRDTHVPGLCLLPAGRALSSPGDLINGERIRRVLDALAQHADLILMDTPPVSLFADTLALSSLADGVILVVRPNLWQGDVEPEVKRAVEEAGGRVLGVILNDVPEAPQGSYRYSRAYANGR